MKILIVSDTPGHEENLERVVEKVGKIDCLLHLGDVEGQEDYIEALVSCPVHIVAGNNDFFSELPREIVVTIGDYRILMTHGHYYGVSVETSMLKEEALARGCNVALYGHTHRPDLEIESEITVLNPGSLSYPRQHGRKPSYAIMEIDEKRIAHYDIYYLESCK